MRYHSSAAARVRAHGMRTCTACILAHFRKMNENEVQSAKTAYLAHSRKRRYSGVCDPSATPLRPLADN